MSPETRRVIEALKWVRHEILALCEATEDDPLLARALQDAEGKQGAYARGRIKEAKGIRRTMAEVIAVKLSEIEDETGWRPVATAAQRCIVSALDEAALARHHADEIAVYRSQLDTTQRALASVVAERDAAKFAARLGIVERVEAAAALVLASGHIHDDAMMIAAALENGGFYICRALAIKPAAEGK